MSTGNRKVDIFLKKFLPQQQITENFFDLLETLIAETSKWVYRAPGVFTPNPAIQAILSSTGPDTINFFTPLVGTDGLLGHILNLDPIHAAAVPFQNTNAIVYHTGLRFNRVPVGTEKNVRTGAVKYTFLEEGIGELAEPTSVVDDGDGTLTVVVNSVCEAGVSFAGRKVRLWLKDPVSLANYFEDVTVQWNGTNNFISTLGALGQQLGSIITDATKYQVLMYGPTIRRNTDLRLDANVVYTGAVTGNGAGNTPVSFNHGDVRYLEIQQPLSQLMPLTKTFLTGGGLITWDLTTKTLTWAANLKYYLATRPYNFTVLAGSVVGLEDGEVLYLSLDEVGGNKVFIKTTIGGIPNVALNEPIVFRYGNDIYFRDGALELKGDAVSTTTGRISDITQDLLTYIGALNESDGDPNYTSAERITQGGSLTTATGELDAELDNVAKFVEQMVLIPHETDSKKVRITGLDATLLNGNKLTQEMINLLMDFEGAVINFDTGVILKSDDATPLGVNFTPFTVPLGEYFWYGIALIPDAVTALNKVSAKVFISKAIAAHAVQASAKLPTLDGKKKLGAVQVKNNAGVIEVVAIHQSGIDMGTVGDVAPILIQETPAGVIDGVNDTFALVSALPMNDNSLLVLIDGVLAKKTEYVRTGMNFTFAPASIPVIGQDLDVFYVALGQSTIAGIQETPTGAIDGVNDLFQLTGQPVNQAAAMVFVDGTLVQKVGWSLVQGNTSYIQFAPGYIPVAGQELYVFYFINVVPGTTQTTTPSGGGALVVYGTPAVPIVVAAAIGVVPAGDQREQRIVSSGAGNGAVAITANPQIVAGTILGQELKLRGVSAVDYVSLADGNGVSINGPINLTDNGAITLIWDGVVWYEDGRR